jgi:hypothetical protein
MSLTVAATAFASDNSTTLLESGYCKVERRVVRSFNPLGVVVVSLKGFYVKSWRVDDQALYGAQPMANQVLGELSDAGLCQQLPARCQLTSNGVLLNSKFLVEPPLEMSASREANQVLLSYLQRYEICVY